ncbi:Uncharacterised protein [Edwardsiella tarda]|nr:Uncharacterised protein [Edwardsiella tarda]
MNIDFLQWLSIPHRQNNICFIVLAMTKVIANLQMIAITAMELVQVGVMNGPMVFPVCYNFPMVESYIMVEIFLESYKKIMSILIVLLYGIGVFIFGVSRQKLAGYIKRQIATILFITSIRIKCF